MKPHASNQAGAVGAGVRLERRVVDFDGVLEEARLPRDVDELASAATLRTALARGRVDVLVDAVEDRTCVLLADDRAVLK